MNYCARDMAESSNFGYWGVTSEEILKTQFPLHRACRDGDVESLSLLLMEAQHGIYVEDIFYGWSPAHWAAYFGKVSKSCRCGLWFTGSTDNYITVNFYINSLLLEGIYLFIFTVWFPQQTDM